MKYANKSLLVTSSLLDSYAWYASSPSTPTREDPKITWKEKAAKELRASLFREPFVSTPQIERGQAFENRLNRSLNQPKLLFEQNLGAELSPFHEHCAGGRQQEVAKRILTIDDQDYLLYGRMDIFFPKSEAHPLGKIVDIKTTTNWKGQGYYAGRAQHPLYICATKVPNFLYVVAIGEDTDEAFTAESVQVVDTSLDVDRATEIITERIREFMRFLENAPELLKAYTTIFTR